MIIPVYREMEIALISVSQFHTPAVFIVLDAFVDVRLV